MGQARELGAGSQAAAGAGTARELKQQQQSSSAFLLFACEDAGCSYVQGVVVGSMVMSSKSFVWCSMMGRAGGNLKTSKMKALLHPSVLWLWCRADVSWGANSAGVTRVLT